MLDKARDVTVLNTLIATVLDSIDGYQKAAQDAENSRFAEVFNATARDRQAVVAKLQSAVATAGGAPEDDGSLLAGAHRAFMGLKEAIMGRDDIAILEEVERGESYLKEKFEAALAEADLSADARAAVTTAWSSVRGGYDQIVALKSGTTAAL